MKLRQTAWLALPLADRASVARGLLSSVPRRLEPSTAPASAAASTSASSLGVGVGRLAEDRPQGLRHPEEPRELLLHHRRQRQVRRRASPRCSALGETGTETSGTAATPASQIPAIQAAISKGANALVVSATDPTALCPTLNAAMKRGITVVTYDSDAPTCRDMFINQASDGPIGDSEVDVLAKQIGDSGQIAIVSAPRRPPTRTPGSPT